MKVSVNRYPHILGARLSYPHVPSHRVDDKELKGATSAMGRQWGVGYALANPLKGAMREGKRGVQGV